MHIELYIPSESRGFVERPESSEFEVTYKDKIQLKNADIQDTHNGNWWVMYRGYGAWRSEFKWLYTEPRKVK